MKTDFPDRDRVRRVLDYTIFWSLVALIALTAIPYGTVDAWWESIFELAVFALTILCIVERWFAASVWLREHRLLLPLFAIVVFGLLQSLAWGKTSGGPAMAGELVNRTLSADPFETFRFALKLMAITLVLGLLLTYASTESRILVLINLIVAVAVVSAVFGLVRPKLPSSWQALYSNRLAPDQSYGQFENRNHFAFLMEMGIGLVLGLAIYYWHRRGRLVLCVAAGFLMWAALLLTHSRGGVVALMFEVPFFVFLIVRFRQAANRSNADAVYARTRVLRSLRGVALAALLVAAVGATVVLIGGDETVHRIKTTPMEFMGSDGRPPEINRPEIWQATLRLIKAHQLAGVGFGAYSVAIPRYLNSPGDWTPEQAHNEYLEVLANGGVIGATLFVSFVLLFIKFVRQRSSFNRGASRVLQIGALSGLFALAVHSLFDFGLHVTVNALVAVALITIAVKTPRTGAAAGS